MLLFSREKPRARTCLLWLQTLIQRFIHANEERSTTGSLLIWGRVSPYTSVDHWLYLASSKLSKHRLCPLPSVKFPSRQSTATAASRSIERLVFLAFQCDHWDLPGRLPLVIGELRVQFRLFGIEPVSLFTGKRRGSGFVGFDPDLDSDFRVG